MTLVSTIKMAKFFERSQGKALQFILLNMIRLKWLCRGKSKYFIGVILDPVLAVFLIKKILISRNFCCYKKILLQTRFVQFHEIFASTTTIIINQFIHYFCNKNFVKLHNWGNICSSTSRQPKAASI